MENQEQKLLENASKKLETLLELKRFAKKIGNYDLAQKCEEIELEKFPLSQEEIDADEEAEKLNLAFRMVELGIDKQTCYRIARTLEQLKKKKGKFSIADSAKIVVDSKRVFLRSEHNKK
jgi:response regulator of citrate/malate metabolism